MADTWSKAFRPIPEDVVPGKRLGRNVGIDSRSAAYPYLAGRPFQALADQLHARHIPILDQGDLGSCTGNAQCGLLGCDPMYPTLPAGTVLDEPFAIKLYGQATALDGYPGTYPPQDTGSDGTSVAKAAAKDNLIAGYTHAVSVAAMADALQDTPLIVGVNWYSSFDQPDSTGLVKIASGAWVRGGHEFLIRGVKITEKKFLADNSWGAGWGLKGSFEFSWDTMTRLLSEQGDATVSVPLPAGPPVPVPVPTDEVDATFAAVLAKTNQHGTAWVDQSHTGYTSTVAHAGRTWLNARELP